MRICKFALAAVITGCLLHGGPVAAQADVSTYSKEAMDNLSGLLGRASKDGFHMASKQTTIFGGWLAKGSKTGKEAWVSMIILPNLDPNKTYRIVASGDNDVRRP